MATLPSPRHLVTSLVSSISKPTSDGPAPARNPLQNASPDLQRALLTPHVLFPNELLPALDVLDRGLVTRLVLARPSDIDSSPTGDRTEKNPAEIFYVRSAQPQNRHHRAAATTHTTSYEVRLTSWSCSCPAFAFAAFPAELPARTSHTALQEYDGGVQGDSAELSFGGLSRGTDMPICKHLLACVLVERCEMFRHFAVEQEVSVEELAGWAAGWGD